MSGFIPKMYMMVPGVKGEVILPAALMGAFELDFLMWPDARVVVGRSADAQDQTGRALEARDFPDLSGKPGREIVTVGIVAGKHGARLDDLRSSRGEQRKSLDIELWIALQHNKFLRGELRSASIKKAYGGWLYQSTVIQARSSSAPTVFELHCTGKMRAGASA